MTDRLEAAVEAVVAAVTDEGTHPRHHRHVMGIFRQQWPTLMEALDELIAAHSEQQSDADELQCDARQPWVGTRCAGTYGHGGDHDYGPAEVEHWQTCPYYDTALGNCTRTDEHDPGHGCEFNA